MQGFNITVLIGCWLFLVWHGNNMTGSFNEVKLETGQPLCPVTRTMAYQPLVPSPVTFNTNQAKNLLGGQLYPSVPPTSDTGYIATHVTVVNNQPWYCILTTEGGILGWFPYEMLHSLQIPSLEDDTLQVRFY